MDEFKCQVIDITRGTTHDGPGMRTTFFLKGCHLSCLWCQNPEGMSAGQEIWWEERQCIHCLECQQACPSGAVIEDVKRLRIDLNRCDLCGACVEACPSHAMTFTGKEWTIDQLVKEALKDKDYYQTFGGGVTVSGGEPLFQYQFIAEFFRKLKANGIHTALDTCGMASQSALKYVLPYTDIVLYDFKIHDSRLHKLFTGQPNEMILENLISVANAIRKDAQNKEPGENHRMKLWLRTPLIPDTTATKENITAISRFIRDNLLDVIERWELCAFNSACKIKYKKMDKTWAYEDYPLMKQEEVDRIKEAAFVMGIPGELLVVSGLVAH